MDANNSTLSKALDEKMQNSVSSDVQVMFTLCQRKEGENVNDRKGQYKFFRHTDKEKDHRITEFYTRLYKVPFESHVQGCTKEHVLLDKDKLDEIINSVISSELRKKIEEKFLLHSSLYELIIPEFKCHGLGFYHHPESSQEIFNKNLEVCYHETCPMYVKDVDTFDKINFAERWNGTTDEEKDIFAQIALCAEKVFELMYPNYKELAENMNNQNLDFNISIKFNQSNQRKSIILNNDEKDKSLFVDRSDRREMNLRSIQRCSKLLDNLTDVSNKEKKEFQNSSLNLETVEQRLLLLQPQLNYSHEPRSKIGKRLVVTFILSLFLVVVTSLTCSFLE